MIFCILAVGGGCRPLPALRLVRIDGSSTVAPIIIAAAELFRIDHSDIDVTVGIAGTGGGFKKFLDPDPALRTDISNASRPIKVEERTQAEHYGISFIELPLAFDGIVVVVSPSNHFCDSLTLPELKRIWSKHEPITNWNQVRPGFPDLPIRLYGPGFDSGTLDSFAEAVLGSKKDLRTDYEANEDDNVLVQAVSRDPSGLGYFGFGYYEENRERLKPLGIAGAQEDTPVLPTRRTIADGSYRPLSRPLFLYVNAQAVERNEVRRFVEFVLHEPLRFVEHPQVGYVGLPEEVYAAARRRFSERTAGSLFADTGARTRPLIQTYGAHTRTEDKPDAAARSIP